MTPLRRLLATLLIISLTNGGPVCSSNANFRRLRGMFAESGGSVHVFHSKSRIECAMFCQQSEFCVSFNIVYDNGSNVNKLCDLLSQEVTSTDQLIYRKAADYYGPPITCKDGWIQNGVSCYLIPDTEQTWTEAGEKCTDLGAHLITLNTWHEHVYFVDVLAPSYVMPITSDPNTWIGALWQSYWPLGGGAFRWVDSQEALNASWPVWASGPLNTNNGNCLSTIFGRGGATNYGKYIDDNCNYKHVFVCEYELL
ncbi:hypothetical protein LSH36_235g03051 [Paralvinella palmiformis]|uniref:C-type lectin n=1 Tax=Paralvinella palmiformis TaxID=53620 RepID=A0AAD9N5D6_9ANNE|nr:hypothetical protein LSH36_235g03051 [Paralvinella palmiformis]